MSTSDISGTGAVAIGEHGLPQGVTLADAEERLRRFVAARLEAPDLRVEHFERLAGGASNHTYLFSVAYGDAREDLIIRWDPEFGLVEPYDMARQYRIMDALQDSAVPVPRTRWLEEDASVLGRAFFVVDRVDGVIGERVTYNADPVRSQKARRSYVETMAAIHAVDWKARGLGTFMRVPGPGKDYALHEVDRWEEVVHRKQLDPDPVMEAAAKWMRDNAPETTEVSLLHGDCSGTNYMYKDDEVAAVIDWEMSTLGDPMVEIGWYCGCIETLGRTVTGLSDDECIAARKEFLAAYQSLTGRTMDSDHIRWGELFYSYQLMSVGISGQWMRRQLGEPPLQRGRTVYHDEMERLMSGG